MKLNVTEVKLLQTDKAKYGWQVSYKEQGTDDWKVAYLGAKDKGGYIRVYLSNSTQAKKKGSKTYYYLHRLVFAYVTGSDIGLGGKEVHHLNFNKQDNRIENLVLLAKDEHAQIHKRVNCLTADDLKIINKARILRDRAIEKFRRENYERHLALLKDMPEFNREYDSNNYGIYIKQSDLQENI